MNSFGRFFRVTTWGESHGPAIGVVIDGCPAGISIEKEYIQKELILRRPGQTDLTSPRGELDEVDILSGIFEGRTTGTPISMVIRNMDVKSKDYSNLKDVYRPGHADFTYERKYGFRDYRGSGRSSGRETASRVAAGAIARRILEELGIVTLGYAVKIGEVDIAEEEINFLDDIPAQQAKELRREIYNVPARCPVPEKAKAMEQAIREASSQKDSLGGIIEIRSYGVKAGLGDPVFGKLDALLAYAIVSVGAVKGVEVGAGFKLAGMRGSQANDSFHTVKGEIQPSSNRAGGILGGISTGMPIVLRAVIKPTPSIEKEQLTVDRHGNRVKLSVTGRHDPCIVIRVIPVLESMVNLVLMDSLLAQKTVRF